MSTVVALRAHTPDGPTRRAYRRLVRDLGPTRVFVVADEVSSPEATWPPGMQVVRITEGSLARIGITSEIQDSGWRCGDYALAVLLDVVACDRAWLVEPDVGLSRLTMREVIAYFEDDPADYVTHSFTALTPGGFWAGTLASRGFSGPEWHSFFPLVRVSRAAVEAAVALRREIQDVPSEVMHPNDETVMASACVAAGLRVSRLEDGLPFTLRRFSPGRRVPQWVLAMIYRGPQIFHPVGPLEIRKRRKKVLGFRRPGQPTEPGSDGSTPREMGS